MLTVVLMILSLSLLLLLLLLLLFSGRPWGPPPPAEVLGPHPGQDAGRAVRQGQGNNTVYMYMLILV